ncbi:hypothetical protein J2X61_006965 [Bacillus sp. 3255]|nr:hypothetical protein [Bacillus sp. 3255]
MDILFLFVIFGQPNRSRVQSYIESKFLSRRDCIEDWEVKNTMDRIQGPTKTPI